MANLQNLEAYASLCSEKTLQSDPNGFFMQFADNVVEAAGKSWIKNVFGKLKTDGERLRLIYEAEPIKDVVCNTLLNVQEIYREKSAEISRARRLDAEKYLAKNENSKALILASQAVLRAPLTGENPRIDDGFTLALAYWTRSEILIELREYSAALADIQAALKEALPDQYKGKSFLRMGICYRGKGEPARAKVSYALAEKLIPAPVLSALDVPQVQPEAVVTSRRMLPIVLESNQKYPNATKKIEIKESETQGRYVVANEAIKTGETIAVEAPYSACLFSDCFGTHCHYCFERFKAPVGCSVCSNVAFCSAECRTKATFHQFECRYLALLIGSGMSVLSHTALRMITQNSLARCLELYEDRSKEKVYSLCTNSQKRGPIDFLNRTLMAAFLLRCLQKSDYFEEFDDFVVPNDDQFKIGELLMYHLQVLQFNAHEMYELRYSENRFKTGKSAHIGVAIYPTISLFNHDCYPAVTRHFVGKNIVVTAIRPLQAGDQVSENYGPIFTKRPKGERERSLAGRYWFKCQCMACVQNWPTLEQGLEKMARRLKCPTANCTYLFTLPLSNEKLPCPRCRNKVSLTKHIEELKTCDQQYEEAISYLEKEDAQMGIQVLCDAIDTFHSVSSPPHRETHLAQELLRAFLIDSGNVHEIVKI